MKDPVCGMDCDPSGSIKTEYEGQTYCFCSEGCKEEFEKDPTQYAEKEPIGYRGTGEGGWEGGPF